MATPPDFTTGQVLTAAQMNAVGLWVITPTTVAGTGVSIGSNGQVTLANSQTASLNGVFTTDYLHYKVIVCIDTVSADTDLRLRYRASGSDNTNASYFYAALGLTDGGAASNDAAVGQTSHMMQPLDAGQTSGSARALELVIWNPKETKKTTHSFLSWGWSQAGAGTFRTGGGAFDSNTSFDGFTVFTANGTATMSGNIRVYGYN